MIREFCEHEYSIPATVMKVFVVRRLKVREGFGLCAYNEQFAFSEELVFLAVVVREDEIGAIIFHVAILFYDLRTL